MITLVATARGRERQRPVRRAQRGQRCQLRRRKRRAARPDRPERRRQDDAAQCDGRHAHADGRAHSLQGVSRSRSYRPIVSMPSASAAPSRRRSRFRHLSVRENVMAGGVAARDVGLLSCLIGYGHARRVMDELRRKADDLLAQVGLTARAEEPASVLTAGQRRLLAIARALATVPSLLAARRAGGRV